MKSKSIRLSVLSLIAMASISHAATVISYSYYTASGSSDTSWVNPVGSTSVKAVNFGGGETTFGGVTWLAGNQGGATYNTAAPHGVWFSAPSAAWALNHPDFYNDGTALLEEGAWTSSLTASGVDYRLDISGFTLGQEYLVQFVIADSRWDGGTFQIDGYSSNISNQDSTSISYAHTDGKFAVITARFIANESDYSFRPINNGSSLQLNGLQILTIPETSTTLLGGLGALALLRRRRK